MSKRPPAFALLLLLGALASPAIAAPQEATRAAHPVAPKPAAKGFFGTLVSIIEKAGSAIDPFGGQTTATPPPSHSTATTPSGAGSAIDPFGGH
jgi:hypothetical protein